MTDFKKHYETLDGKELVEIIESISSYEPEIIEFCIDRLKSIKVSKGLIKKYSRETLHKRFFNYFSEGKYLTKELINIDSYFYKEKEVKEIFKEVQLDYIRYVEAATFNLPSAE